jgi:AbiTii
VSLKRNTKTGPELPTSHLIKPDVPISGIRLSGWLHREARDGATRGRRWRHFAAYERYDLKQGSLQIAWPPGLTVLYQQEFFQDMVLNRAWQDIPMSAVAALLDTVRNRILEFALELKEQLGTVDNGTERLETAKVDRSVVNIIYGGNNVIASTAATIQQAGRDLISVGDASALIKALGDLGVIQEDTEKIIHALTEDGKDGKPSLGQKTIGVIKTIAGKLASAGKDITVSAATSIITQMVLQYLGSNPLPV